jgi:hypothetical protein
MRSMSGRPSLLPLVLCLVPLSARAVEPDPLPGWTEATRNQQEIVLYKEDEAAHARSLVGFTEFDAPPKAVFDVVADLPRYLKYAPYLTQSDVVERPGPDELIAYQVVKPPFTSVRDFYSRVRLTRGTAENGGVFTTHFSALRDYKPEKPGVVRMLLNEGGWRLEPIDGGKRTRATYHLLSTPGGMIPRWILDMSSISSVSEIFTKLREQLKLPATPQ